MATGEIGDNAHSAKALSHKPRAAEAPRTSTCVALNRTETTNQTTCNAHATGHRAAGIDESQQQAPTTSP
jgi:hypothetical protein